MESNLLEIELGVVKEYEDGLITIILGTSEIKIDLTSKESELVELLLMNEDIDYVAFNTKSKKIDFTSVIDMSEFNLEELQGDLNEGVDENGNAE